MVDAQGILPLLDKAHELAKQGPFDPFLDRWKQVGENIANNPAGTLRDFPDSPGFSGKISTH